MKRGIAIVLTLCLLVGLTACGEPVEGSIEPIDVKEFETEAEMQDYLEGVWSDEYGSTLYFFNGDRLFLDNNFNPESRMKPVLDNLAKSAGREAFSNMVVKDIVSEQEKKWFDYRFLCQFNPKKSEFTSTSNGTEYTFYVGEGIICDSNGENKMQKLSDTPSYTVPGLIEKFEDACKNYMPNLKDLKRTNKQYAMALMELHPETKQFPLALQEENEDLTFYTDTGNANNYSIGLMWANNSVLYAKDSGNTDIYTLILSNDILVITDHKNQETWESLTADALALFGEAPGIPTPKELANAFRENGKTKIYQGTVSSSRATEYTTEFGGVTCRMESVTNATSNFKRLRFEL